MATSYIKQPDGKSLTVPIFGDQLSSAGGTSPTRNFKLAGTNNLGIIFFKRDDAHIYEIAMVEYWNANPSFVVSEDSSSIISITKSEYSRSFTVENLVTNAIAMICIGIAEE